jgi:hypothetical protein
MSSYATSRPGKSPPGTAQWLEEQGKGLHPGESDAEHIEPMRQEAIARQEASIARTPDGRPGIQGPPLPSDIRPLGYSRKRI